MATRVRALKPGESPDPEVNKILQNAKEGWFLDTTMFGVIGHKPELLKRIVRVFEALFGMGEVPPHLLELMRIRTGNLNACTY